MCGAVTALSAEDAMCDAPLAFSMHWPCTPPHTMSSDVDVAERVVTAAISGGGSSTNEYETRKCASRPPEWTRRSAPVVDGSSASKYFRSPTAAASSVPVRALSDASGGLMSSGLTPSDGTPS